VYIYSYIKIFSPRVFTTNHKQSHPREGNLTSEDPHPTPLPTVLLHYSLKDTHRQYYSGIPVSETPNLWPTLWGERRRHARQRERERERERESGTVGNNNYDNCQGTQLKDQSAVITNPPA